ncbi:MAG: hypothetical protein WKF73_11925 [Nocardioidaceae bacterium]
MDEIKGRGLVPVLADAMEDENYFARDDGGAVYRFIDGRYVDATRWLGSQVRSELEEEAPPRNGALPPQRIWLPTSAPSRRDYGTVPATMS